MNWRTTWLLVVLVPTLTVVWGGWRSSAGGMDLSGGQWRSLAPMPTARSEMPAAVLDGVIYLPGGIGVGDMTLTVFESYDLESGRWSVLEPLPLPLHHTGAAAAAGRIFVAGGYTDLEFRVDNPRAFAFDPTSGSWSRIADMPAPRAGHALAASGGSIYAVGGVGPGSAEVWAYDPESNEWETGLAPMPTPREHLTVVAAGGLIYAIGGRAGGRNLATVEVYDPVSDGWEELPGLPTPRSGLSGALVDGAIHVGGGEDLLLERTFDEHEILDLSNLEWRSGTPLTSPRHGLASAGIDGTWYVLGGATGPGAQTFVTLIDRFQAFISEPTH